MSFKQLRVDIQKLKNPTKAKILARFFKTGKGEYGEGDVFIGLTVPQSRMLVKKYRDLSLSEIKQLLRSRIHEERLIALLILVYQFKKGNKQAKRQIYNLYLSHAKYINNWDLVDLSAPKIVGEYLLDKPRTSLYELATSKSLWKRRIAMLSTFQFICLRKEYLDTFAIAELLLEDKHDLIHKAVGWMLREVGKRISVSELEEFLDKYAELMPRTMLRYAIERLPQSKRNHYMLIKSF